MIYSQKGYRISFVSLPNHVKLFSFFLFLIFDIRKYDNLTKWNLQLYIKKREDNNNNNFNLCWVLRISKEKYDEKQIKVKMKKKIKTDLKLITYFYIILYTFISFFKII